MSRFATRLSRIACLAAALLGAAHAQRHSFGSAPPTAPTPPPAVATHTATPAPVGATHNTTPAPVVRQPPPAAAVSSGPIAPISSGLGAIQFLSASFSVPAPQSLTRQLQSDDERARLGALSSLGAPGQYLNRGHIPFPHSLELDLLQLGSSEELDAVLTIELDEHVVSAILVPEPAGTWRRVATLTFASSFSAGATTPSNFVRPLRSWLEPGHYRAVYHATVNAPNGDFTENEADLRILNGHAAVVISFVSGARQCDLTGQLRAPHQTCEIIQRWLEPDPNDATHRFTLVTGIGHISAHENDNLLSRSRNYRLTRLRSFACQPFFFSEGAQRFEPTANSTPCTPHEAPPHQDHPGITDH